MKVINILILSLLLFGCDNNQENKNCTLMCKSLEQLNTNNLNYFKRETQLFPYMSNYETLFEIDSIVGVLLTRNSESKSSNNLLNTLRDLIKPYDSENLNLLLNDSSYLVNDSLKFNLLLLEYIIGNEIIQKYNSNKLGIIYYRTIVETEYLDGEKVINLSLKMVQYPERFFGIVNGDTIYSRLGGVISFKHKDILKDSILHYCTYDAKIDKYYNGEVDLKALDRVKASQ